jgi:hypothetical protein
MLALRLYINQANTSKLLVKIKEKKYKTWGHIIIDSAILTFESFHVMKHMNDRTRMIGLKLDMSMAHDRI